MQLGFFLLDEHSNAANSISCLAPPAAQLSLSPQRSSFPRKRYLDWTSDSDHRLQDLLIVPDEHDPIISSLLSCYCERSTSSRPRSIPDRSIVLDRSPGHDRGTLIDPCGFCLHGTALSWGTSLIVPRICWWTIEIIVHIYIYIGI